jgi:UDP-glucose 4-epimerase
LTILVTGGAGYIGSAVVERLRHDGTPCVVVDNLSRGHRQAVPPDVPFYEADVRDATRIAAICQAHGVRACVHLAAAAYVGESVQEPCFYYQNNVVGTLRLLDALREAGVGMVVFSSSCSIYGTAATLPVDEDCPPAPQSPYARTKWIIEQVLDDYSQAYGLRHVTLRYFNAAGATANVGENHDPETHIIPLLLQAAAGLREFTIFGTDYPTADGTAVRDFVHIADIAAAHALSLTYLRDGGGSRTLNLGSGRGTSVREAIAAVRTVTGCELPVATGARRPGDPPAVWATTTRARAVLGWTPTRPDLVDIVRSAWDWMRRGSGAER